MQLRLFAVNADYSLAVSGVAGQHGDGAGGGFGKALAAVIRISVQPNQAGDGELPGKRFGERQDRGSAGSIKLQETERASWFRCGLSRRKVGGSKGDASRRGA